MPSSNRRDTEERALFLSSVSAVLRGPNNLVKLARK